MSSRLCFPALIGFVALAGCAGLEEQQDGPFYPSGFADGCRTAENLNASFNATQVRDDILFKTEDSYRFGWRSGFTQCDTRTNFDNRPGDLGEWSAL